MTALLRPAVRVAFGPSMTGTTDNPPAGGRGPSGRGVGRGEGRRVPGAAELRGEPVGGGDAEGRGVEGAGGLRKRAEQGRVRGFREVGDVAAFGQPGIRGP